MRSFASYRFPPWIEVSRAVHVKEAIPQEAGDVHVPCVQREATPFGGVIGMMDREVAPPLAVVIPEVVILVLPVDPDRQF